LVRRNGLISIVASLPLEALMPQYLIERNIPGAVSEIKTTIDPTTAE
jgi:hypothetical protein